MGGRMGGGRRGGAMGGAKGGAMGGARPARRAAATPRASRPSGGAMGGRRASAGGGTRRMAQAPRTPQQRRRERRQDRRDARKARRMAQAGAPGDSTQQPGSSTSGDEGWFDGGGFDLSSLFPQSNEPEDYTSAEFDASSLSEPYQKYADDPEEGWITGLMRSGQKGYDLPKEVTVASAMNSPFRYYGGY